METLNIRLRKKSTAVVEVGIDVPNATVMAIEGADRFGLAQLHQFRGRVGRGANQAYAYLLHPKHRALTEEAQARLATIFEASELGAGFHVALRDLEIRGAGNLLGDEQSGHIREVGFELYQSMLEDAILAAKAGELGLERERTALSPQITVDAPIMIPEDYVPDLDLRMGLYRRLNDVDDRGGIDAFAAALARVRVEPFVLPVGGTGVFPPGERATVVWAGVAGAAHFDGGAVLPALQETRRRARAAGLRAYTSLVPTQISRLVSHASIGDLDAIEALKELALFDAVLIGADALNDDLRKTMRAYDIHFVATYGATETCGGCVYNDQPLKGVELTFVGDDPGQIVVTGPMVARRYRDGDSSTLGNGRWMSNDLGRMRMGRLEIVGRTDDQIKVGGHIVALPLIARHLRTLAELKDVAVLSRTDAEWGHVPVAFVVGCPVEDQVLRQFAAAATGRSSIPMDIVRLDALPLLPNGKVDRQRLLEL